MRGQLICQFFKSQSSDLCWSEIMFSQIMAKWNKSGKCMSFFNKAFNINYCSLLNMLPNFDVEMFFLTGILVIIILLIVGFVCSIFDQNVKWSFVPSFFFFFEIILVFEILEGIHWIHSLHSRKAHLNLKNMESYIIFFFRNGGNFITSLDTTCLC